MPIMARDAVKLAQLQRMRPALKSVAATERNTMKREDIKAKITGVTDEQLDWLMDEHGADITREQGKLTKLQAQVTDLTSQLTAAKDGLKAFEGVDVNDLKGQISKLQGDLTAKDTEYQQKLADRDFEDSLDKAISGAKGRNAKAIRALLDLDAIKASKNQEADLQAALQGLQKESGYLFESDETPPPFAPGPGTTPITTQVSPEISAIRAAAGLKTE